MDRQEFEDHVLSGAKDDYVSDEALNFLAGLPKRVRESEGMDDPMQGSDHMLFSRSLGRKNDFLSAELEDLVRDALTDGNRDIQKLNLRENGQVAEEIVIVSADFGYKAVADHPDW